MTRSIIMTIDSVQIECFVAASKYLNFSRAANSLYISQPVLSRRIARLEQELDVTLFDRTGRTLKLTDAGRKPQRFFRRFCGRNLLKYLPVSDRHSM